MTAYVDEPLDDPDGPPPGKRPPPINEEETE